MIGMSERVENNAPADVGSRVEHGRGVECLDHHPVETSMFEASRAGSAPEPADTGIYGCPANCTLLTD
jgi:hypothetical protein